MDASFDTLPNDVETLRAMVLERDSQLAARDSQLHRHRAQLTEQLSTIEQLQREKAGLEHRLDAALRRLYGRLSERLDPNQLLLFGRRSQEAARAVEAVAEAQQGGDEDANATARTNKPGHGRRRLPDTLPRHRVEHDVPEAERACPCCDKPRVRIGEQVSEQLDYVPASLFVIQHIRPKYACPSCEEGGVAMAAKPAHGEVIEKGLPGPGLVAHVVTSKYADHQPLYRQEAMLARHAPGLDIPRSTQCGWVKAAGDLVEPLVRLMARSVRESKVIHTDDTPVPVQAPGQGKTRTGRMWVYLGDDTSGGPYTVFDYTPTRSRDGPTAWLGDYRGYLQADAFAGYDGIYAGGRVVEVACWAHTRRKFYDARQSDPTRSHEMLAMIQLLYRVERKAKGLAPDVTLKLRRERAVPVLEDIRRWLDTECDATLPKSPMGQAIAYARNHWVALTRYATDPGPDAGCLAIDNNVAERAIRPLTLGRKNYQFLGSDAGGRTAANLYSVVASAKRHGLDPFVYLRDVFATLPATPITQLDRFLPDRWRDQQLKEIAQD